MPTARVVSRAAEVMMCTSAIRNLIRQAKTHQIYSLMQIGGSFGMQTMDQGLAALVKAGLISEGCASTDRRTRKTSETIYKHD